MLSIIYFINLLYENGQQVYSEVTLAWHCAREDGVGGRKEKRWKQGEGGGGIKTSRVSPQSLIVCGGVCEPFPGGRCLPNTSPWLGLR